jgi:hypothetical protein
VRGMSKTVLDALIEAQAALQAASRAVHEAIALAVAPQDEDAPEDEIPQAMGRERGIGQVR